MRGSRWLWGARMFRWRLVSRGRNVGTLARRPTCVLRPELCPTWPMRLEVDGAGWTRPASGKPNVEVCLKADENGLRNYLLKSLEAPETR